MLRLCCSFLERSRDSVVCQSQFLNCLHGQSYIECINLEVTAGPILSFFPCCRNHAKRICAVVSAIQSGQSGGFKVERRITSFYLSESLSFLNGSPWTCASNNLFGERGQPGIGGDRIWGLLLSPDPLLPAPFFPLPAQFFPLPSSAHGSCFRSDCSV